MYYTEESGKRTQEKKEMKYDKEIAALKARMETETDKVKKMELGLALHACLQVQTEIREAEARIASFEAHADRMLKEVA
jgi:hypothetical protein